MASATYTPRVVDQQSLDCDMSVAVDASDNFPSEFAWDGRGYELSDFYVELMDLLDVDPDELRCVFNGYSVYEHPNYKGVSCPVDKIYKPMLDVGKYHIQRSYEHRNRSADRALDRLNFLKEEVEAQGKKMDYLIFIDLTTPEFVSEYLKDPDIRDDVLSDFRDAVSEFFHRLYDDKFPDYANRVVRCDAYDHTVEDCPDCYTEKVRCDDVGSRGHHVEDCPNCYDIDHRCDAYDHTVEDCPDCYTDHKRGFAPMRTIHVWSSEDPTKPHLHTHTVMPNISAETIKVEYEHPAGSGCPNVKDEAYLYHRFKPMLDEKRVKRVWRDVLIDYDFWDENNNSLPDVYLQYIRFRGEGRVASQRAREDNTRIHFKLNYMCRLPLEDLNKNLSKADLDDPNLEWLEWLINYTTSRANLGFAYDLKRIGYNSNESIPVRCPVCQSELVYVGKIVDNLPDVKHLIRNNDGKWERAPPPPDVEVDISGVDADDG